MAEAAQQTVCYCHVCEHEITPTPDHCCPSCTQGFIEILDKPDSLEGRNADDHPFSTARGPMAMPMFGRPFGNRHPTQNDFERQLFQSLLTHSSLAQQQSSSSNSSSADEEPTSGSGRPQVLQFTNRGARGGDFPDIVHQILMAVTGQGGAVMFGGPGLAFSSGLHGNPGDYAWGAGGLDEIITQLMNQLEGTGPPPASAEQIENLNTVIIGSEHKNMQCSVCISDFEQSEEVKQLPCQHLFHKECIVPWLQEHGTCPVCRKTLDGNDTTCVENAQSLPDTLESYGISESSRNPSSTRRRDVHENLQAQNESNVPGHTLQGAELVSDTDEENQ